MALPMGAGQRGPGQTPGARMHPVRPPYPEENPPPSGHSHTEREAEGCMSLGEGREGRRRTGSRRRQPAGWRSGCRRPALGAGVVLDGGDGRPGWLAGWPAAEGRDPLAGASVWLRSGSTFGTTRPTAWAAGSPGARGTQRTLCPAAPPPAQVRSWAPCLCMRPSARPHGPSLRGLPPLPCMVCSRTQTPQGAAAPVGLRSPTREQDVMQGACSNSLVCTP